MDAVPRVPPLNRPATYQDLLALPHQVVGEIDDGELHVTPRPFPRHAVVCPRLGVLRVGPFDAGRGGSGRWWILTDAPTTVSRA
jgi:hypothetical protein